MAPSCGRRALRVLEHPRFRAAYDLLRLRVNDIVTILRKENDGWWLGILQDEVGWFPEKFCAEIGSQSLSDLSGDAARRPA